MLGKMFNLNVRRDATRHHRYQCLLKNSHYLAPTLWHDTFLFAGKNLTWSVQKRQGENFNTKYISSKIFINGLHEFNNSDQGSMEKSDGMNVLVVWLSIAATLMLTLDLKWRLKATELLCKNSRAHYCSRYLFWYNFLFLHRHRDDRKSSIKKIGKLIRRFLSVLHILFLVWNS